MEQNGVAGMRKRTGSGFSRMARLVCVLLAVLMLPAWTAGENTGLSVQAPEETIRPGRAAVIRYNMPEAGTCDLVLRSEDGKEVSVIVLGQQARAGENSIHWNGTWNGVAAPEGTWRLCLETDGGTAETLVTVGPMAPCLIGVALEKDSVEAGEQATVSYYATEAGLLKLMLMEGEILIPVLEQHTDAGKGKLSFSFHLPEGSHALILTLTDADGTVSEVSKLTLKVTVKQAALLSEEEGREEKKTIFTPSYTSPYAGMDAGINYWTTPMNISDEAAVWEMLTSQMTVIDNGQGERGQIILRSGPSADSEGLGSVTCETQGVHVLERGEEWSLIECYSTSFHDSPILNWNARVQGYVPTKFL